MGTTAAPTTAQDGSANGTNGTRAAPDASALQALLDREAIRDLRARFSQALDNNDFDLLGRVVSDRLDIDYNAFGVTATSASREEFVGYFRQWYRRDGLTKQHLLTNHVVQLDGADRATGKAELLGQYHLAGFEGGEDFTAHASYDDEYERAGDGWRFRAIRLHARFITGNPRMVS